MSQSISNVDSSAAEQTYNGDVSNTTLSWSQLNANSANERRRIRANETSLRDGEWEKLDETVFPVLRDNLVLVQALEGAGLTTDITMAHTESTWSVSGDTTPAEYTMDPRTRSEEAGVAMGKQGVPIPLTHKDYRIGERELRASRNMGTGLDTMMARIASRKVSEALEDLILYGVPDLSVQNNGNMLNLPGLLNYPDRVQYTGTTWGTSANVVDDINEMIHRLEQDNFDAGGSGYWLLHGTEQKNQFRNDYQPGADAGDKQVATRIDDISEISNRMYVPRMPDGEALLIKPIQEVIDLARDPDGPQNLQWTTHGGMEHQFKVMALYAPRIKSTYEGTCGIVHASGLS